MKKIKLHFLLIIGSITLGLTNTNTVSAQAPASHIFHMNTWYMIPGQDSAIRAERNAMLKEYHTKVTMKNEFVLHVYTMTHFFTDDSREFVTITEYASMGAMEKSFDRDSELEKQAWPNTKQREDFLKKMNGYFTYHKDAIFHDMPELSK